MADTLFRAWRSAPASGSDTNFGSVLVEGMSPVLAVCLPHETLLLGREYARDAVLPTGALHLSKLLVSDFMPREEAGNVCDDVPRAGTPQIAHFQGSTPWNGTDRVRPMMVGKVDLDWSLREAMRK